MHLRYFSSLHFQEQDKSSDIEQQQPFGDRKISNIQPQNRGGEGFKFQFLERLSPREDAGG